MKYLGDLTMIVELLKYTNEPEKTCAIAGRLCYSDVGIEELKEQLTQEKIEDILKKIIKSGHLSVLEHASFSFGIEGVSRALLAQLTRHRIASFSVQSQRYVKFNKGVNFIIPPTSSIYINSTSCILRRITNKITLN